VKMAPFSVSRARARGLGGLIRGQGGGVGSPPPVPSKKGGVRAFSATVALRSRSRSDDGGVVLCVAHAN